MRHGVAAALYMSLQPLPEMVNAVPYWVNRHNSETSTIGTKRSAITKVGWTSLLCILATFPASGQVENATEVLAASGPAFQAAQLPERGSVASERSIQEIRAPRLIASEPLIDAEAEALPLLVPASRPEAAKDLVAVAPAASTETSTVAYDRIAALAAIPLSQPAASPAQTTGSAGKLAPWTAQLRLYAVDFWRQIGLVLALLTTLSLLILRIGERGRHSAQELVLEVAGLATVQAAAPSTEEIPLLKVTSQETEARPVSANSADRVVAREMEDGEPRAQRFTETPEPGARANTALSTVAVQSRTHPTLREAIEAIKADMRNTPAPKAVIEA